MKKITHVLAVAAAAVAIFFASPAGHAVLMQYPVIAPLANGLAMIMAIYHNPIKGGN